jgi:transposase
MARRRFQLTKEQEQELIKAYASCKDGLTRTRYQAVRMYGTGYATEEVLELTRCSRTSLMEWSRKYQDQGVEGLIDQRAGGNRAKLSEEQINDLGARLQTYTPADLFGKDSAMAEGQFWTVPDLHRAVQEWYSVSYQSPSSYYRLFDLCGFSYQRPAKVYKSHSATKGAEFEEQLEKNSSTSLKKPLKR